MRKVHEVSEVHLLTNIKVKQKGFYLKLFWKLTKMHNTACKTKF